MRKRFPLRLRSGIDVLGQRGATAVEFALVFPMLFVLFYSIVIYSYLFVLQENLSFAAQEAAAAAHRVNPVGNPGFQDDVRQQVGQRAAEVLAWLPASQQALVRGCADGSSVEVNGMQICVEVDLPTNVVTVNLSFDSGNLFPVMRMPLLGELPPMPGQLTGSGSSLVGDI